jgi:hypothetical protein
MALILGLIARTPRPVWGVLAVLAVLGIAYGLGVRHTAEAVWSKERKDYRETIDRIDRTLGGAGGADAARGRLRDAFGQWPGDL